MRNPDRLDDFYTRLHDLHKKYVPDWRFGQLMSNLLGEVYQQTGRDIFFLEEDEMIAAIEQAFEKWKGSDAS